MTYYPTTDDILRLHEKILAATGGASGVRDRGLLESALARPRSGFGGVEFYESIWDKAASLMHGLVQNHPFVDGNKRTGMAVGAVFLLINGYRLLVSQDEFEQAGLSLATGTLAIPALAAWLKGNCEKV